MARRAARGGYYPSIGSYGRYAPIFSTFGVLNRSLSALVSSASGFVTSVVWSSAPSYSITEGTIYSNQTVPVSAGGASITLAWVSGTVGGVFTTTKPSWITFTAGTSPTISFSGAQVDANDITGMILSATANSQTVNSSSGSITVDPVVTSLTVTYTANEGTAFDIAGSSLLWASAFTTKDGTLVEWATGVHGHGVDNGVREFNPVTNTYAYVESPKLYDTTSPNLGYYGATYGYPTQYDNLNFYYVPRIDSLVIPARGQYVRGAQGRPASQSWPFATRAEVVKMPDPGDNYVSTASTSFVDGLEIGWKSGVRLVDTTSTALIRPVGTAATNPGFYKNPDNWFPDVFNPHQAWCAQLDAGFSMGGGNSDGDDHGVMWVIAPGANFGISNQYALVMKTMPTIGGVKPNKRRGRDGACAVGTWIYWVGGQENTGSSSNHLWRLNLAGHVNSNSESVPLNSGAYAIERLQDAPFAAQFPLLVHDNISNALLYVTDSGIALFDLRTLAWRTDIATLTAANAAYLQEYSQYGFPRPYGCLGGFINSHSSGVTLRKVYWRPGYNDPDGVGGDTRQRRFRSIKINRPADQISYLTLSAANPENPATDYTNPFIDIKHHGMIVNGTGESRTMTLISGDFYGYPMGAFQSGKGYKPEGSITESGRQDIWRAPIGTSHIGSGSIRFSMVSNGYAAYPWNGTAGVNAGAVEGPRAMDAIGACVDKRGQWWVGPCDNNDYVDTLTEWAGQTNTYAPMFKWTQPGTNATGFGVAGVALGNGWEKPTQDKLYKPGSGGTFGVDYDVALTSGAADNFGWGRTNARGSVYDATNDRIYAISFGASGAGKTISIQLHAFNPDPVAAASAGKYAWTKLPVITRNLKEYGGPADSQYTGINISGWGDNSKGMINCAPELIGRKLYFVVGIGYTGPTNGLVATRPEVGAHTRAHLFAVDLDKATSGASDSLEWIPFPENQNWWLRAWDGPDSVAGGANGEALTPAQYRGLACVGNKLVLGPDSYTKIGVDPWIQVYDTTLKTWTSFNPPTNHDWPQTLFPLVGVPDLGEVWLCGSQPGISSAFRTTYGMHNPTSTSGRRIVRFRVLEV